jgi:lysophospholipase L1-like esterase
MSVPGTYTNPIERAARTLIVRSSFATTTGAVGDFFCDDHTHFSKQGVPQIAELVAHALLDKGLELAPYLK